MKILLLVGILLLTGCASSPKFILHGSMPYAEGTPTTDLLRAIPKLDQPVITIAVYNFPDRTGQRKPSVKFSQLSSAVSQAPETYLIDALKSVSEGDWFKVVERQGLDSLIKERQLIRSTREQYDGETQNVLKPLLFAGLLIEGGIVGYDTNTSTGGMGARLLGIGISSEYRKDTVSIGIRLVSVATGEILLAISTEKTIFSVRMSNNLFKFIDAGTKLLEIEAGFTDNESVSYAVRKAIDQAILELIKEGETKKLWEFKALKPLQGGVNDEE